MIFVIISQQYIRHGNILCCILVIEELSFLLCLSHVCVGRHKAGRPHQQPASVCHIPWTRLPRISTKRRPIPSGTINFSFFQFFNVFQISDLVTVFWIFRHKDVSVAVFFFPKRCIVDVVVMPARDGGISWKQRKQSSSRDSLPLSSASIGCRFIVFHLHAGDPGQPLLSVRTLITSVWCGSLYKIGHFMRKRLKNNQ